MARRRVRIRDKNKIPEVIGRMEKLNGKIIRVGIFGPGGEAQEEGSDVTVGHLAAIHEYGVVINVTEKMRKFLAVKGLRLKKDTKQIIIPERSFIRAGWDENERKVIEKSNSMISKVIENTISVDTFLDALGVEANSLIRDYARDLRDPSNHPFTVEQKESSNPLVDNGGLIEAISYEVL